jgi:hypothetical protein
MQDGLSHDGVGSKALATASCFRKARETVLQLTKTDLQVIAKLNINEKIPLLLKSLNSIKFWFMLSTNF